MAKDDHAWKQTLQRMVETMLAANAMNGGEEDRGETLRGHKKREVVHENYARRVQAHEGDVDKIMKDDECGVQIDEIRMSRSTKGNVEREVRNGRNDEIQIICTVNKDEERGKWKTKEIGNDES